MRPAWIPLFVWQRAREFLGPAGTLVITGAWALPARVPAGSPVRAAPAYSCVTRDRPSEAAPIGQ